MFENSIPVWTFEPRHDKTNKMAVHTAKTQISLGIRSVWSESSLSAWRNLGSLATHWAHSEDWSDWADARLIWEFAVRAVILLVLSCRGSFFLAVATAEDLGSRINSNLRVPVKNCMFSDCELRPRYSKALRPSHTSIFQLLYFIVKTW